MTSTDDAFAHEAAIARDLIVAAAIASTSHHDQVEPLVQLLARPSEVVDHAARQLLLECTATLYANGWQPAELLRQGKRGARSAAAGRLAGWVLAADHATRRSVNLHSQWVAQVESLELPKAHPDGFITQWTNHERVDRFVAIEAIVDVYENFAMLPKLDALLPPPGSGNAGPVSSWLFDRLGAPGTQGDPMLLRIRNLLAKAESTTFEAEAMSFTAKAQELMTRHAIDIAMLQRGATAGVDQPTAIRLPLDAPYADTKGFLLHTVAVATRCRVVQHVELAMATVAGMPGDLASVEMLFTSLLVQAQMAMDDAAHHAHKGAGTRTKSFRIAFLTAYTSRIGERLRAINDAVTAQAEAEHGGSLLPVLQSRAVAIDAFIADRFGELVSVSRRRSFDAAGWTSGRAAAERAKLNGGNLAAG